MRSGSVCSVTIATSLAARVDDRNGEHQEAENGSEQSLQVGSERKAQGDGGERQQREHGPLAIASPDPCGCDLVERAREHRFPSGSRPPVADANKAHCADVGVRGRTVGSMGS